MEFRGGDDELNYAGMAIVFREDDEWILAGMTNGIFAGMTN